MLCNTLLPKRVENISRRFRVASHPSPSAIVESVFQTGLALAGGIMLSPLCSGESMLLLYT